MIKVNNTILITFESGKVIINSEFFLYTLNKVDLNLEIKKMVPYHVLSTKISCCMSCRFIFYNKMSTLRKSCITLHLIYRETLVSLPSLF